jgi:uncharacterized protein (UPF0335 family)
MSRAHNPRAVVGDNSGGEIDAKRLASFARRAETLERQVAELNRDKSDVFKEAKRKGFDPVAIKQVMARRRKDPEALKLRDETVARYERAINDELGPPDPAPEE